MCSARLCPAVARSATARRPAGVPGSLAGRRQSRGYRISSSPTLSPHVNLTGDYIWSALEQTTENGSALFGMGGNVRVELWRPLHASPAEDPEAEYFYALGRFVHEFGRLELAILIGLRQFANLNDKRGRLLLSGHSADRCVKVFRDIAEERSASKKEVNDLFKQYETIKKMRDYCVHRTADRQPAGNYASHNEATSKRDEDNEYSSSRWRICAMRLST